jgi:ubiquinone biosynthesis protein
MGRSAAFAETSRAEREPRASRSRRLHREPRARASSELRLWLSLADGVLGGIERLAWDLRAIVDAATETWDGSRDELRRLSDETGGVRAKLARLQKTGWMLTQVAAGYRLLGLRSAFVSKRRAQELRDELHARSARSFYETSAEQGGAFSKVGQLLSARADLLPAVWVQELSKLQDAAPSVPFEHVRATIEEELGALVTELFAELEPEPIAAASIGQVHRGLTHSDEVVAVKVQRPQIADLVAMDLDLLELCIDAMRSSLPPADYATIVEEVRSAIRGELDYAEEAHATQRMADFFAAIPGVLVPRPLPALCSPAVLTTTFMDGRKISVVLDELCARREAGDASAHAELSELLGRLLQVYLRQVLQAGLFQADPHPGNFLVTDDHQLVLLDFGCSKELSDATRRRYCALVRAFLARDKAKMTQLFAELGFVTRSGDPATLHAFTEALLGQLAKAATSKRIEWPDRDALMARVLELLRAQQDDPVVTLPAEFVMLARVFGTLGGFFAHYRPDIDYARHVLPVLATVLAQSPTM